MVSLYDGGVYLVNGKEIVPEAEAAKAAQTAAQTPAAPDGTVCPSCGASAAPGVKFCPECGAPLSRQSE